MIEQISFDTGLSDERKAFNLIYPELCDIIDNAPMESKVLVFEELSDFSSVYFLSSNLLLFQIRLRKKSRYLLIPYEYAETLPPETPTKKGNADGSMIRVLLQSPEDVLLYVPMLRSILHDTSRRYVEFGCCSRYEACSDAKKCIHPDIKFALGCFYRKNLRDGKIFYGRNRNIP